MAAQYNRTLMANCACDTIWVEERRKVSKNWFVKLVTPGVMLFEGSGVGGFQISFCNECRMRFLVLFGHGVGILKN